MKITKNSIYADKNKSSDDSLCMALTFAQFHI